MRVLAVDWSGDAHLARDRIWLAEAVDPGRLVRLEAGRDRPELGAHLLEAAQRDAAVGLDFGFAFPAWFTRSLAVSAAPDLWRLVAERGEQWLGECRPPFWGRAGRPRPTLAEPLLRRAELALPRTRGVAPKSVFQIGGAGSVGTGSVRGMPLLHHLHAHGARVWPFTDAGWPLVLEIYPRLLTGPVIKSNVAARRAYLAARYPGLDPDHARAATDSEDAFDAAVSALRMVEHAGDLRALPIEDDAQLRLEGRIWHPGWRTDDL